MSDLSVEMTVHSTNRQLVPVTAQIEGRESSVLVDGLAVQLVPKSAHQGSMTLNFFGDQLAAAQELLKPNASVKLTIAGA